MANRASCTIMIGGYLAFDLVSRFVDIAQQYDMRIEDEGEPFEAGHIDPSRPLELYGTELADGLVPALEGFLIHHRLHFRRISAGCPGAFDPEIVVSYGARTSHTFEADDNGKLVFPSETILQSSSLEALQAQVAFALRPIPAFVIGKSPRIETPEGEALFVLAAPNADEGLVFWNNTNGFGFLAAATVFTGTAAASFDIPIANDAPEWMALPLDLQGKVG